MTAIVKEITIDEANERGMRACSKCSKNEDARD